MFFLKRKDERLKMKDEIKKLLDIMSWFNPLKIQV